MLLSPLTEPKDWSRVPLAEHRRHRVKMCVPSVEQESKGQTQAVDNEKPATAPAPTYSALNNEPVSPAAVLAVALMIARDHCGGGRSSIDTKLWDLIKTLRTCRTAGAMVRRIFDIGVMHGQNMEAHRLVLADRDPNSYAMFCRKCGCRWSEHNDDGRCKRVKSVVPKDVMAYASNG